MINMIYTLIIIIVIGAHFSYLNDKIDVVCTTPAVITEELGK